MRTFFITLSLFLFLVSCGSIFSIDNPVPINEKQLESFPLNIQGEFLNYDDNSILTITDNSVTKIYDFEYRYLKDSISNNNYLIGDTLFYKYSDDKEKISLSGDTIIQHVKKIIPLFEIFKDNVLKKYKGHYFLNNRINEFDWILTILSVEKGVLKVRGIYDINIDDLESLAPISSDTTSFEIGSIKKSLKGVLIQNGIGRSNYFRMRKNDK